MGGFSTANAQAGQFQFQAGEARTRGIQQRAEAFQKAYSLENEAAKNSFLAMGNMAAMRENQTSDVSRALADAASSGFMADTGSKRVAQTSVAGAWESRIANMNKSNVIADENARGQAAAMRRYGNSAKTMAEIEANYYEQLYKNVRNSRWWYLLGDVLTLGGNAGLTYTASSGGGGGQDSTGSSGSDTSSGGNGD